MIGCDAKTLRKYFRDELTNGATEANAKVAQSLYNKALGDGQGSVTAAIFWCKTRMGWRGDGPTDNADESPALNINITTTEPVSDIRVTRSDS